MYSNLDFSSMIHYTNNYWVIALCVPRRMFRFAASTARHLGIKIITDPRYYKSHLILHSGFLTLQSLRVFSGLEIWNESEWREPRSKAHVPAIFVLMISRMKTEIREPRQLYFVLSNITKNSQERFVQTSQCPGDAWNNAKPLVTWKKYWRGS